MATKVTTTKLMATSASTKSTRPPQDNYYSYAMMLLMKSQLGKNTDEDFMGKFIAVLKMAPKDKTKMPSSEDTNMKFSKETIREFETRYADIVPLGPNTNITLSNTMTRRMALFLKLYLKGAKNVKLPSISSYCCFKMRGEHYAVEKTGLLIYIDKSMLIAKVTRVISVDVLTFTSDDQPDNEATSHTFMFALMAPLRNRKFEAEQVYPLGWYAPIVRPVEFEEHEGEWYSAGYNIPSDLDHE